MSRISKKDYYLSIAEAVAKRSTCLRRQYGAVIVNNDEIVSTGYNGSPRGTNNCCDFGYCWREANGIAHGKEYESCLAVHAEQNAIISADRKAMMGSTLYLVGFENGQRISSDGVAACKICSRMIINSGVIEVIT